MALQVGDALPRFELSQHARPFRAEPGGNGLVVYFMRAADCAMCRAHVKRLSALHAQLRSRDVNVVIVVPAPDSAELVASSLNVPWPVVQGNGAHASAGLSRVIFDFVQQSGTVIADGSGRVVQLRRATVPNGALDEDALLDWLDALPPRN